MKSFAEIKRLLQDEAKPYLMARYPITEIGVFGSYVRGEADADSDLDVLVAYDRTIRPFSLFDVMDAESYLTTLTGIDTHLALKNKIAENPYLQDSILSEVQFL